MLRTMDRKEWKDDPVEVRLRDGVNLNSNPSLVRRLYPLRAKLIRYCRVHQLEAGHTFEFVRPKHEPALYPLEALVTKNGQMYKSSYNSEEIELIPAV